MKKLLAILCVLCLLPFAALAEEEPREKLIEVGDLNVYFVPPADTILLTRDSNAFAFIRAGRFRPNELPYMEEYDIYAMMLPEDGRPYQFTLALWPTEAEDLDGVTNFMAARMCSAYRNSYEAAGYIVETVEYRTTGGYDCIYIAAHYPYEDGTSDYLAQYGTTQNGYALWVDLLIYNEPIPAEALGMLSDLIDTVWCETVQE